jgi:hypothetical protein
MMHLKFLGSFLGGRTQYYLNAEFSVELLVKNLSIERVVNEVLRSPITERDTTESRRSIIQL